MACGTPVLATPCGSVPEIVIDGVTGFIRPTVDGLVEAASHLNEIDRAMCRAQVEQHFSARSMAVGYEHIYDLLIGRQESDLAPFRAETMQAAD